MDDLNYRGKFRYPPEIDPDNEIDRKWLAMNGIEEVTPEQYYRPKSVLVNYFLFLAVVLFSQLKAIRQVFSNQKQTFFSLHLIKAVQKVEMEAAQMSKALFNPREINELIELVKLEPNPTNIAVRPKSSNVNSYSISRDFLLLPGFLSRFTI